jgi:hypothetical protein
MFELLFGMCCSHHVVETRLHDERKVRKKLQKDMKEVKKALYPNKTPPPGFEERESNPPTPFEQQYESFDPSQPFAPYSSTTQMRFDSQLSGDFGQQDRPFEAPPPLPNQQARPSDAEQSVEDLFSGPNHGMASSALTSFTHTTMPTHFDSSLYTKLGSH